MTKAVPIYIGTDLVPMASAIVTAELMSQEFRGMVERIGEPTSYNPPTLGALGKWIWPDNTMTAALTHPAMVRPPVAYVASTPSQTLSLDGGRSWVPVPATVDLVQFILAVIKGQAYPAPSNTTSGGASGSWGDEPEEAPEASTDATPSMATGDGGGLVLAALVALGIYMLLRSTKRPKRAAA